MITRSQLAAEIAKVHEHPQMQAKLTLGLNTLFDGLDMLAQHGVVLQVDYCDPLADGGPEWPKMLYHQDAAPEGKVFHQEEHVPTEPGWSDKPLGAFEHERECGEDEGEAEGDRPTPLAEGEEHTSDGTPRQRTEPRMAREPGGLGHDESREFNERTGRPSGVVQRGAVETDGTFPRRIYHPMFPGGMMVNDSGTLDSYKSQGWSEEAPEGQDGKSPAPSKDGKPEKLDNSDGKGKVAAKNSPSANPLAHPEDDPDDSTEAVGGNAKAGRAALRKQAPKPAPGPEDEE